MNGSRRRRAGVTLIELVVSLTIAGILASAFSMSVLPLMNTLVNFPQTTRVQNAAADLLQIIVEGDHAAKGLRYAGPPCVVGGGGGGGNSITVASTSSDTSTLEYNYADADYCGAGAGRASHTVTLTYDRTLGTVTRAVDGGSAIPIPSYVGSGSEINFSVPGGGTDLFHYFDVSAADMGSSPAVSDIYRVDIDVIASSGTGAVQFNSAQMRLKTGVEIKRYTA